MTNQLVATRKIVDVVTVTITSGTPNSGWIDTKDYISAKFKMSVAPPTSLAYRAAANTGDTFRNIHDAAGALITPAAVVVNTWMPLPDAVLDHRFFQFLLHNAGTNENAASTTTIEVQLRKEVPLNSA